MHSSIRNFALPLTVFAVAALGACKSDVADSSTRDVLAQDSTLDLAVMSATGNSVGQSSGDTNLGSSGASASTPTVSTPAPSPVSPITTTRQPAIAPTPKRVSTSAARALTRRNRSGRLVSTSVTTTSRARIIRTPARTRRQARVLEPTAAIVPTGSSFSLVTQQKICASSARTGDTFSASLTKDVTSSSGVVIPVGTSATGEVVSAANGDSRMKVALKSIDVDGHSYPVRSDVTFTDMQNVKIQPKGGSTSRVLAGAGLGAILGRVMGRSARSTVIGAAGGAAAGAVVAGQSVRYDQCVPDGGQIIAHLSQPLRLQQGD